MAVKEDGQLKKILCHNTLSRDVATLIGFAQDQGVHEQCFLKAIWETFASERQAIVMANTLALIKVDLIQKVGHNNMLRDVLSEWEEFQTMSTIHILVANVCW